MAHKKGAVMVVDGAQSTPHMPVNVQELGADFFAFSGHKVFGPMGIGGLYGREDLLEEMPPFLSGGEMIESVTRTGAVYAELPHKFEAGTVNAAGAAGLAAAIQYVQSVGFDTIQQREHDLTANALARVLAVPHVHVLGTDKSGGPQRHHHLHGRRRAPARHQRDHGVRRREHPRRSPLRAAAARAPRSERDGARQLCLL